MFSSVEARQAGKWGGKIVLILLQFTHLGCLNTVTTIVFVFCYLRSLIIIIMERWQTEKGLAALRE